MIKNKKHFVNTAFAITVSGLLTACGGPSSSDIEHAMNGKLELVKSIQGFSGGKDTCPSNLAALQKLNYLKLSTCLSLHSTIEDLSISNCVEKSETIYSCSVEYVLSSQRYGEHETANEITLEEMADGWVIH